MNVLSVPEPRKREFLPAEFKLTVWSRLKPYFNELLQRPLDSLNTLEQWIFDWNELNGLILEDINWRYVRFTSNTLDERASEAYFYAIQEIIPKAKALDHKLIQKLFDSNFHKQLDPAQFSIFLRCMQNTLELYNDDNIPKLAFLKARSKEYSKTMSQVKIEIADRKYNLQQAGHHLESENRAFRATTFLAINERLEAESSRLDSLFDELLKLRHQIAQNSGFDNFRDYSFKALGRFDYSPANCETFHHSIKTEVLPVLEKLYVIRQKSLKIPELKPWDLHVNIAGKPPMQLFKDTNELTSKTIRCLNRIDLFFGNCLKVMQTAGHLDLNTRTAKRPGGYNMSLPLSGIPYIFMNAGRSTKDITVLAHESGHAVHSFLMKDFRLNSAKRAPAEIAELAAMSMELFVIENLKPFTEQESEQKQIRLQQYERILYSLCWIACVDKFQHWLYTHPGHSVTQRNEQWLKIFLEFTPSNLSYEGFESYALNRWKKQLHIFELPFYYIEYGFAQLGAIALWKQYTENPHQTIKNYKKALKTGYTKTVPEVYETAGIQFDFSAAYIRSLVNSVQTGIEQCVFEV